MPSARSDSGRPFFHWPAMFGLTVYDSIRQAERTGEIPFPHPSHRAVGGHAVDWWSLINNSN